MVLAANPLAAGAPGSGSWQMNRPRTPLIIHHQGFLPYLPFCLMQNIRSQPGREIILLGDAKNRIPGLQYRHVDSGQFQSLNEQLIRSYRHATDADFHDERRCLERWFILAAFLPTLDSGGFYFADSDYLLFSDLAEIEQVHPPEKLFGTPNLFGFAYFPDQNLIRQFCLWLLDLYGDEKRFSAMQEACRREGGRLQEMTFIQAFCRETGLAISDRTWKAPGESACLDDGSFGSSFRYTKPFFQKIVQARTGGEVSYRESGKQRRLVGLHFGGHKKNHIPAFTGWSPEVLAAFFRPNFRRNTKHLLQYLFFGEICRQKLRSQSSPPLFS